MDAIKVSIGGEEVDVPLLTFARLKKVWPLLDKMANVPSLIEEGITNAERVARHHQRVSVLCEIVSAALSKVRPELTAEEIEERLLIGETYSLIGKVNELLEKSGLEKGEGQPPAVAEPGVLEKVHSSEGTSQS